MKVVGFDFGTTNSLVSVVSGDRVIDVVDGETGRPHPSVVRYEGERVIVGREAKDGLGVAGIGVHGNTVKSPKFLLGEESVPVGGVDRSPIDIVADVVGYVRTETLRTARKIDLEGLRSAVVTIPVTMDGRRRTALREAFAIAGMSVTQFVHEPFAALYGYIRGAADPSEAIRRLARRNVLVVDWGGGTLDLTLCRIDDGQLKQVRNGGTAQVGGDEFDRAISQEVVKRFRLANALDPDDRVAASEAELQLLQDAERNKIALSTDRSEVTFYRPSYFASGTTLQYKLSREELEEVTRPLVRAGIKQIETLLDGLSLAPGQVSKVIFVGGMSAMPAIRGRLYELFGPDRVEVPPNSATLISQGAAWIAHDRQRLRLAKPIELELARGALMPLLSAGTEMPLGGDVQRQRVHLFCADPTDGLAKFPIQTPLTISSHPQASDLRAPLGVVTVSVDAKAPPLHERLELDVTIDEDLILTVTATSCQKGDRASASYFDLEFGLGLPFSTAEAPPRSNSDPVHSPNEGLALRGNIAGSEDSTAVPGDVLYKATPNAFQRHARNGATPQQLSEHLYYQPCAICRRPWGDPNCRCGTA